MQVVVDPTTMRPRPPRILLHFGTFQRVVFLCSFHKDSRVILFVWKKSCLTFVVKGSNAK